MAFICSMTAGRPGPLIFFFALPLMVGNLFQQFYTVADAMIVGLPMALQNTVIAVGGMTIQSAANRFLYCGHRLLDTS